MKNSTTAADAGTQAQLHDSKGLNPRQDARRRKGGAGVVSPTKGRGTAKFRKARSAAE